MGAYVTGAVMVKGRSAIDCGSVADGLLGKGSATVCFLRMSSLPLAKLSSLALRPPLTNLIHEGATKTEKHSKSGEYYDR